MALTDMFRFRLTLTRYYQFNSFAGAREARVSVI